MERGGGEVMGGERGEYSLNIRIVKSDDITAVIHI